MCSGSITYAGVTLDIVHANRDLAWRASRKMNLKADIA